MESPGHNSVLKARHGPELLQTLSVKHTTCFHKVLQSFTNAAQASLKLRSTSESPINFSPDLINALQASPEVRVYDFSLIPTIRSAKFGANNVLSRRIVPAAKILSYTYNNVSILSLLALTPSIQNAFPSYKNRFRPRQIQPPSRSIQMLERQINPPRPVESTTKLLQKVIGYEI